MIYVQGRQDNQALPGYGMIGHYVFAYTETRVSQWHSTKDSATLSPAGRLFFISPSNSNFDYLSHA